jgi:hypothetical protein
LAARGYALAINEVDTKRLSMSPLTIYIGKLLGLYCIAFAVAAMANKKSIVATMNALIRNPPLLLYVDIINLAVGLALVIGHNVWSGGLLPVAVTLVGWAALIKGLLFLFLSPDRMIKLYEALHYEKLFFLYMGATLLIGVYLTIAAFSA